MRNKMLTVLALTLFLSAFLLHTTAYASGPDDSTAPTLTARLSGETLHIEAKDEDSGVKSVYIDGHEADYPAKGMFEAALWDYAGTGQYVSIYAVDYSGNQSGTVQVENPYYKAETAKKATESAVPAQTNDFTPEGTGTTIDNATDSDGKEFFTITTPDENVFYLIVDRQREEKNVYFLNAVTEDDLRSPAKKDNPKNGESAIPTQTPDSQTEVTHKPDPEPEPQPEKSGDSTMIFVVLAVIVAGGAGYYFKIYKPKHQATDMEEEEFDEDEIDYEDETELPPEPVEDTEDLLPPEDEFGEFADDPYEEEDR